MKVLQNDLVVVRHRQGENFFRGTELAAAQQLAADYRERGQNVALIHHSYRSSGRKGTKVAATVL